MPIHFSFVYLTTAILSMLFLVDFVLNAQNSNVYVIAIYHKFLIIKKIDQRNELAQKLQAAKSRLFY